MESLLKNFLLPCIIVIAIIFVVRQTGFNTHKPSTFLMFTTIGEVTELKRNSLILYQPIITQKEPKPLTQNYVTFFYKNTPEIKKIELVKISETDFKRVLSGATSSVKKPGEYKKEVDASLEDIKLGSKVMITGTRTNLLGYPIPEKILILPDTFTLMRQASQPNK